MSYVLDGIKTAWASKPDVVGNIQYGDIVLCPCGWTCDVSHMTHDAHHVSSPALRFHYQNCEQAKLPTGEPE